MPACDNCGSNGFACIDGKFYCVECDTQSQNFVDEQAPQISGDSASFLTKALKKRKEKDKLYSFGRVWYTVEGYQAVVKAHVEALIRIGVRPDIDTILKQIWFKYIHTTGMAFIDSGIVSEATPDKRLSFRDYFLKYHSKDDAAPSVKKLRLRYSKKSRKKRDEKLDHESEWFSVDTEASSTDDELLPLHSPGKRSLRRRNHSWHDVKSMSLAKVISFCYLALRWMNELYTIGDLIHWAECGKIPYYDAAGCFPTDMKLFYGDNKIFSCTSSLKYQEVLLTSHRLQKYLKMPALPDVNITGLVSRYLYQMNLPFAFATYARKIVKDINLTRWPKRTMPHYRHIAVTSLKSPDLIAVAIVVILLKIFFVLDGKKEWTVLIYQDRCKHHDATGEKCVPFTWKSWVMQHLLYISRSKEYSYLFLDSLVELDDVGDVHAAMEHYMNVVLKGLSHKRERYAKNCSKAKELSEIRQQPFKRLVSLQGSATVLDEKQEMRSSHNSAIQVLGRNPSGYCGDLTSNCLYNLSASLITNIRDYIRYDKPVGHETLDCFPDSYAFLLTLLSEVTKAEWSDIHKYTIIVENAFLSEHLSASC